MKGNRLISKIIMVVIFLVGFGFILYPIVANEWNEICRRKVITVYDRQVEQSVEQGKISYEDEKRKADEYNKALRFNITDDGFVSNNDNSVNNSDNDTDEDNNKDNEESSFDENSEYNKCLNLMEFWRLTGGCPAPDCLRIWTELKRETGFIFMCLIRF